METNQIPIAYSLYSWWFEHDLQIIAGQAFFCAVETHHPRLSVKRVLLKIGLHQSKNCKAVHVEMIFEDLPLKTGELFLDLFIRYITIRWLGNSK